MNRHEDMKLALGGNSSKFLPNANFVYKFGQKIEESFLNVNRQSVRVPEGTSAENIGKEKKRLIIGNEADIFTTLSDGSLKWDVELLKHEGVYSWVWGIKCSPDITFNKQPPLTAAEVKAGCIRPPEIINSYAVYSGKEGHYKNKDKTTIIDYGTGKLCHITRPKIIDNNGVETWGTLDIIKISPGNFRLIVSVSKPWLDTASFPVLIDPTIGNTMVGASTAALNSSYMWGDGPFLAPASGTIDSITVHSGSNPKLITMGLYDEAPSLLIADTSETLSPANAWHTSQLDAPAQVVGGQSYWLMVGGPSGTQMRYDTIAGSGGNTNKHPYLAGEMPSLINMNSTNYGRRISIFTNITITNPNTFSGTTEGLTIAEHDGDWSLHKNIDGTTDELILTENNGVYSLGLNYGGTTDGLTITEHAGTWSLHKNFAGTTDELILSENSGSYSLGLNYGGTTDGLNIAEHAGTWSLHKNFIGTTDDLILTENNGVHSSGLNYGGTTDGLNISEHAGSWSLHKNFVGTTDKLILTTNPSTWFISGQFSHSFQGTTETLSIAAHAGLWGLALRAGDGLCLLTSLRAHILTLPASAGFYIEPDNLQLNATEGQVVSYNGDNNQNFSWEYEAQIFIKNFSGNSNIFALWLLQWLHKNQPAASHNAIKFDADIIDDKTIDLGVSIPLTETVLVQNTQEGLRLYNPAEPDTNIIKLPATDWALSINDDPTSEWTQL